MHIPAHGCFATLPAGRSLGWARGAGRGGAGRAGLQGAGQPPRCAPARPRLPLGGGRARAKRAARALESLHPFGGRARPGRHSSRHASPGPPKLDPRSSTDCIDWGTATENLDFSSTCGQGSGSPSPRRPTATPCHGRWTGAQRAAPTGGAGRVLSEPPHRAAASQCRTRGCCGHDPLRGLLLRSEWLSRGRRPKVCRTRMWMVPSCGGAPNSNTLLDTAFCGPTSGRSIAATSTGRRAPAALSRHLDGSLSAGSGLLS
jgi:hypothetical protein